MAAEIGILAAFKSVGAVVAVAASGGFGMMLGCGIAFVVDWIARSATGMDHPAAAEVLRRSFSGASIHTIDGNFLDAEIEVTFLSTRGSRGPAACLLGVTVHHSRRCGIGDRNVIIAM
jgi:hypothetical protein